MQKNGFRKPIKDEDGVPLPGCGSRGTQDHLYTFNERLNYYKYVQKKPTHMFFLDFSKAFDRCDHDALFVKLHRMGIDDRLLNAIMRMSTT